METLKCIKCGKDVSEEEFRKRYQHLIDMGIQPLMVVMCQKCRDGNVKKLVDTIVEDQGKSDANK